MNVNGIDSNNVDQEINGLFDEELSENESSLKIINISMGVFPEISQEKYNLYLQKLDRMANKIDDPNNHWISRKNQTEETLDINANEPDLTVAERKACRYRIFQEIARDREEIDGILKKIVGENQYNANQSEAEKMLGSYENRSKLTFEQRDAYRQKLFQEIARDREETADILNNLNRNGYVMHSSPLQMSDRDVNKKVYQWACLGGFGSGGIAVLISLFIFGPIGALVCFFVGGMTGAIGGALFAKIEW